MGSLFARPPARAGSPTSPAGSWRSHPRRRRRSARSRRRPPLVVCIGAERRGPARRGVERRPMPKPHPLRWGPESLNAADGRHAGALSTSLTRRPPVTEQCAAREDRGDPGRGRGRDRGGAGSTAELRTARPLPRAQGGADRDPPRRSGSCPPAERGPVGSAANEARAALESSSTRGATSSRGPSWTSRLAADALDVTLPGAAPVAVGHLHLLTSTRREIEDVFVGLGYRVDGGAGDRARLLQLHRAQPPAGPPGADAPGHLLRRSGDAARGGPEPRGR